MSFTDTNRRRALLATATISSVVAGLVGGFTHVAAEVSVVEYTAGISSGSAPANVVTGPDGNMWFTEDTGGPNGDGAIGRITAAGVVTEFTIGFSPFSIPWGIAAGSDGNLWFTEPGRDQIGRVTPAGAITEFATGIAAKSQPREITAGPDGALWFTEYRGGPDHYGAIGRITTTGSVTEFSTGIDATTGHSPWGITTGPDGNLWFTEQSGAAPPYGGVGRITATASPAITQFTLPATPNVSLVDIAAGPDGNLWFANGQPGSPGIWRISPEAPNQAVKVQAALSGSPRGIAAGPAGDGDMWFTEAVPAPSGPATGAVGRIATGPTADVKEYPVAGSGLNGIASGPPDGTIWFADQNDSVGRVSLRLPAAPTAASATAGDGRATVTWHAPPSDGGEPVSSYTVRAQGIPATSVPVQVPPEVVGGDALTAVVAGLTNGGAYTFTVSAGNANGVGSPSAPTSAVTPRGPMGWREVASPMAQPRYLHTATLLDGSRCRADPAPSYCGEVLVAGGTNGFLFGSDQQIYSDTELFDPASSSGTWNPGPQSHLTDCAPSSSCTGRFDHTATLIDGPRCRASPASDPCGTVLVVGGSTTGFRALPSTEIYHPLDRTWSPGDPLDSPRTAHTATLLDPPGCHGDSPPVPSGYPCGQVLVAGGSPGARVGVVPLATATLYDPLAPAGHRWSTNTAPMNTNRAFHTASLLEDGRVLVAGGFSSPVALTSSSEIFDPTGGAADPTSKRMSGSWEYTAGLMAVPRASHTATLLDGPECQVAAPPGYCGRVLVSGGIASADSNRGMSEFGAGAEVFDPAYYDPSTKLSGRWIATGSLHDARGGHTATLLKDGEVVVAGGGMTFEIHGTAYNLVNPPTTEIYDPVTGAWSYSGGGAFADPLHIARGAYSATLLDGPKCRGATPPEYCGRVLATGGGGTGPQTCTTRGSGNCPSPIGTSEEYTPAPRITSLTPSSGSANGGTPITIRGTGFQTTSTVSFGDVPATAVVYRSPTELSATSPPQAVGAVTVGVGNDEGRSRSRPPTAAAYYTYDSCDVAATSGQVSYPPGYSLIGAPGGTAIPSDSLRYGWFDLGGGGGYTPYDPTTTTADSGHGYWAWFECSRPVSLSGTGTQSQTSALGGLHASMVGNPSGVSPAMVSGQDFSATWLPSLNGGAGGYHISGYREQQPLAVGEGAWIFAYHPTAVSIQARG